MINVHSADWSAGHLAGQVCGVPDHLTSMLSGDPAVQDAAFANFYAEAHAEGAVDPCTAASLPFLFAMADDAATPCRGRIVELLLSIGRASLNYADDDICFSVHGVESTAHVYINAEMPRRADAFARYATDEDPLVRRPAIQAVGLFAADSERIACLLNECLRAESGIAEQLLVVKAMARLAIRLPQAMPTAVTWLEEITDTPTTHPNAPLIRLAALIHRSQIEPGGNTSGLVPRAIALLQEIATYPSAQTPCDGCRWCQATSHVQGRDVAPTVSPAHLAADFFDPDHIWQEHSPVSSVLRTLHTVLGDRIAERSDLLVAQLSSPDTATRYDAIAMAECLPGPLPRPVLRRLLALLPDDWAAARMTRGGFSTWHGGRLRVAPEDTTLLLDTLAEYTVIQRSVHGSDVWACGNPFVRQAYQEAIMTLADHRDPRALPDLIRSLDTRVDDWRALYGVGGYPQAADRLVPLLAEGLRRVDPERPNAPIPAGLYLSCLAELKDPIAIPVLTETLAWAQIHHSWSMVTSVLKALAAFGRRAQTTHALIRPLTDSPHAEVRAAAEATLDAFTASPQAAPGRPQQTSNYGTKAPY
ncbi:HEAT repeat domain-containing protein [Streptomyces sp. NPDC085466]|uniref:HEAT repeat domain-containing protein n=1 Tax=Streptomyces sp. NPDC085466 TaxID=3365725 RepID=UPI0037D0D143